MMNRETCVHGELLVPLRFARRMYYSGVLSIISVALSLYLGLYDFTLIAAGVLVNSINYWRYPVRGWRRNLDMAWTWSGGFYQISASFGLGSYTYLLGYWVTLALAIMAYSLARKYGRVHQNFDVASKCHVSIHIFGNISNIILYLGLS